MGKTRKSNRSCKEDDDDLMYYAELLLDLPRLIYMSEFSDARWKSTKKRSPRSRRVDFNCKKAAGWSSSSSVAQFGVGASFNSVSWQSSNKSVGSGLAGKKRKNPNPPGSMEIPLPPCKKRLLKVKFKLSGTASLSNQLQTVAEKDSSSPSGEFSAQATCCYLSASETEPSLAIDDKPQTHRTLQDNTMKPHQPQTHPAVHNQPLTVRNNNINYCISNLHMAATAKEKRMMRMIKLRERKRMTDYKARAATVASK